MQLSFDLPLSAEIAYDYGTRSSGAAHGVVLTKPHVVELILDLAGYTVDRDLTRMRLLEPSCGEGAFLGPALDRLLESAERHGWTPDGLGACLAAYDVVPDHIDETKRVLLEKLGACNVDLAQARRMVDGWVTQGDFLLASSGRFDAVIGNPPYVRIEQIPVALQAEYRRRFEALYDRADLYVAFIEKGLSLLAPDGVLSFICADRWISNRYGAPLRSLVARKYHVDVYLDLHDASPFESDVIAYPSIFAIRNGRVGTPVRVGRLRSGSPDEFDGIRRSLERPGILAEVAEWFEGDEPWIVGSPDHLRALRDLETRFDALEADGRTRVRIGVATGADEAYIVGEDADVEADRLVPLVMRDDIEQGTVRHGHRYVLNTFGEDGRAVDLRKYPRLERHLLRFEAVKKRHVAKKNPKNWFRTIDRVYPELVPVPKLLIPDIAGANEIAFEPGQYFPHHNLYFVISTTWDMEVLGALLSSRVALFFVWSYAVKMRGGYLRFQAQYLRRIRVPAPASLADALQDDLRQAFRKRDFDALDRLALAAYGLDDLPAFDFVDTRR